MSKKRLFTGLLALLLVFALLGCEQVTSGGGVGSGADPNDKWTEVTSLDGLEGPWKSSATATEIDSGGKPTTVEQAMIITYPVSEKVSRETGEVDIKDGVKIEILSNGKPVGYTLVSKNEFESMLKNGFEDFFGDSRAFLFVNGSKTRLKMESITSVEGIKDEATWKEFQDSYKKMAPTGDDITVAFSAGAPYTVTTTQILHKQ